jgi:hypothetical protein
MLEVISFRFITLKKLAELSGYSQGALHKKIHDGVLSEGVQYLRSPDGRIHFNIEEYDKWIRTNYRKA